MKRLRIDLYTGLAEEQKHTFKDSWLQVEGETVEDLAERVRQMVIENLECILESEGIESDTDNDKF